LKPLNIWLINHYAADMFRDKAGRHYWFAKYLEKIGYSPKVICASTFHNIDQGIDTGKELFRVTKDGKTPFIFVRTTSSVGNGIDRILNMVNFYRHLYPVSKRLIKQFGKPDVILASSVHPLSMVAGVRIARKLKIPCICEIRDLWPEAIFAFGKIHSKSLLGRLLTTGEYWIYRHADALIFTKEGDADYLLEKRWDIAHGGKIDIKKCYYINNGVNLQVFDHQVKSEQFSDDELTSDKSFKVIYAGMIRPVNNVGNLLDCAKFLKAHEDIKFLIYGDGNQLPALQARILNENITNVSIKGFVERKYIPFILSHSSINILNYSQNQYNWTRGNSSNKLFEYMASGKPIISTVKMGYSIIDKYDCGTELEESTPKQLAEAILKIYRLPSDEYQKIGMNARRGSKDFDYSILTNKLDEVIKSVAND